MQCGVTTKTIVANKKEFSSGDDLSERIAMELGLLIRSHLAWLQSFDYAIVYYDRGQKQVTRVLKFSFLANLADAEFRVAHPDKHKLFQVADLVCTLESLRIKLAEKRLSKSETEFFRSGKRLKKNYLKWLGPSESTPDREAITYFPPRRKPRRCRPARPFLPRRTITPPHES